MKFAKWLDERTGLTTAFCKLANMRVPGGKFCCRALPISLVFLFLMQAITGVFLWAFYSPSATSAWESVFYIQYVLPYGWLLRGLHHYCAQLFVGLSCLYVFCLIVHGAYRRPREFVYWSALGMFLLSLCSCLTGDLLSWSQSGYFATITRVSFLQLLPGIGTALYKLVAGGPDPQFGTLTLTRFLVLHVGVFGGGGFLLLCLWKYFDIRSQKLVRAEARFDGVHKCCLAGASKTTRPFWSRYAFLVGVVCLVVLGAALALVFQRSLTKEQIVARADSLPAEAYLGAELTAPVDVAGSFDAARPEWSFRAFYALTKFPIFSKIGMVYAIFGVSSVLFLFFILVPILGRSKILHCVNVIATLALAIVAGKLTYDSYYDDYSPNSEHSATFLAGTADAARAADRAVELAFAPAGIPKTGALTLTKSDPYLQGPVLFNQHCASCHNFKPQTEEAQNADYLPIVCDEPTAPNLYGAHTAAWIRGFTNEETLADVDCFGATAFAESGSMITFMRGKIRSGLVDEDGNFIMNSSAGLVSAVIAPDASPAVDVLEAVFEDFAEQEENLELLDKILNEDDDFEDDEVEAAKKTYVAKLEELVNAKFDDEDFVAELEPKLPAAVLQALRNVLLATFEDDEYQEALFDEDNIELIKDDSAEDFIADVYLEKLNGDSEPIPPEKMKYIDMVRAGLIQACDRIADVLADEATLDAPRPFVGGEYLGLDSNAISDMKFLSCTQCHAFYGSEKNELACDLRAYMSRDWIAGFIADPTSKKYYGAKNDRMPAYCPEIGDKLMNEEEVALLADWLSGKWYRAPKVENGERVGKSGAAREASLAQEVARLEESAVALALAEELDARIAKEAADKLAAEEAAAKAKEEKAKAAAEKAKADADAKAQQIAQETAKLKEDLAAAQKTLADANAAATNAANEASASLANVVKERDAARGAASSLQQELTTARDALKEMQAKGVELAKELETVKTEAQKRVDELNEAHRKNMQLQKEASDAAVAQKQAALEASDANAARLADALRQAQADVEALRARVQALENQHVETPNVDE